MNKFECHSRFMTWFMAFLLSAFVAGCGGGGGSGETGGVATPATADTTRPTVTLTVPAAGVTDVATNTATNATFSEDMDPATITETTFTLTGPGTTVVAGTVTYAVGARTATFTPTTPATLPASTLFTATITTGAKDLAGNALASNFVWTFTTGVAPDTTAPTITSTNPANGATGVCINKTINATFSEAMDPLTITTATFTLQNPDSSLVEVTVSYDTAGSVSPSSPAASLAINTTYTVTMTTGAKDVAGNALASNNVWTFTTGATTCTTAPSLGSAQNFAVIAAAAISNAAYATAITGDMALSPNGLTSITGFIGRDWKRRSANATPWSKRNTIACCPLKWQLSTRGNQQVRSVDIGSIVFRSPCAVCWVSGGQLGYYRISGEPVYEEAGAFTGFHGTGLDIAQCKRAEIALRESEARLRDLAGPASG